MNTRSHIEIPYTRFLDEAGAPVCELPAFASSRDHLIRLYRWLQLTRIFDAKAVTLQRTGRLGTYASSLGQEAVAVGIGDAMYQDDVLLPSFREHGTQFIRGVTMTELLLFWGGDERGSDFAGPREDFPIAVPVGSHAPHAAGVALALKLRGGGRAAVCVFGDGATSKGDVYEAMNLAGIWELPVVFVVTNNRWAISVPVEKQTAANTIAQKAIAAGFDGEQVDGNDVVAVREVIRRAVDAARTNNVPHLVECLTYRLADHTTADDASRYRDDEEVSEHWKADPLLRMRQYLTNRFDWTKAEEQALLSECEKAVKAAADDYLDTGVQAVETIVDYMYAERPADLEAQRRLLLASCGREPDDA